MDSHTTGRAKDAWRQRNNGAAGGDGQPTLESAPGLQVNETPLPTDTARRGRPRKT